MKGEIFLDRVRQRVRIGCTESERSWPQQLVLNLWITFDHEKCVETDSIDDTIDYMGVLALIDETSVTHEWKLIETYADDLAYAILERYNLAETVKLSVTKTVTPVAEGVSFVIQRER